MLDIQEGNSLMDTRDGRIFTAEEWAEKLKSLPPQEIKYFKPMALQPTRVQMRRVPPKVGRNEPCPCGSGEKFKRCCLRKPAERGEEVE